MFFILKKPTAANLIPEPLMTSPQNFVLKERKTRRRSVRIDGEVVTITLEEDFWVAIEVIAQRNNMRVPALLKAIYHFSAESSDANKHNLASAIRTFCLNNLY
jgi:predicted DNA-binding ribbon-helix-helix protein